MNNSSERRRYAQEIEKFIQQNPERKLNPQKVYEIFNLYEKWRNAAEESSSPPFDQHVIYYIAERAFWTNIIDSECVGKLLEYIFQSLGHFGFFLCPNDSNYSVEVNNTETRQELARYFLSHACKQKIMVDSRRVVDVDLNYLSVPFHPCEVAAEESPEFLLLLLQYGALMPNKTVCECWFASCPGNWKIITLVVCIMCTILQIIEHESSENQRMNKLISCGKIMLRVCPQIRKKDMRGVELSGFASWEEAVTWLNDNLLPNVRYRILVPMPLTHACRLRIRRCLNDNWQLPHGIKELKVPDELENYLNINID